METKGGTESERNGRLTMEDSLAAKRQAAAAGGAPTVQDAAMTNQAGEIVSFDTAGVYLDSVAKGL